MKEEDILKNIRRLQLVLNQCHEIDKTIKEMCISLDVLWDREATPPIHSIVYVIQEDIRKLRLQLCEIRGE